MIWLLVGLATLLPFIAGASFGFWWAVTHVQGATSRLPGYRDRWLEACRLIDKMRGSVSLADERANDARAEMVVKLTRLQQENAKLRLAYQGLTRRDVQPLHTDRMERNLDRLAIEKAHRP
jgi:hypothetical protein